MRALALALLLAGCGPQLTDFTGVAYDPAHPDLKLDLYVPRSGGPVPLVVYFHGGGWHMGNRNSGLADWLWLLDRGYALATVEYRLSGEAPYPAAVQDGRAAVRALRRDAAKYGVDPARIALAGNSAGAHLAALLALSPGDPAFGESGAPGNDDVSAVVGEGGPYDLRPVGLPLDVDVAHFLGPDAEPDRVRQASPVDRVGPGAPAFLLLHGEQDSTVPIAEAERLAAALAGQGCPVELLRVRDAEHGLAPAGGARATSPDAAALRDRIEDFLRAHLRQVAR